MIGQFSFSCRPSTDHILLELKWRDGERVGRIRAPTEIIEAFGDEFAMRADDEFVQLGVALGYGVTIASMTEIPLTLTGDRSAWPRQFGVLLPRGPSTSSN